jgi:hypothetical protein
MFMLTSRQAVEAFHLVFLRALTAKGEDKALIALKGGANLRFFFGSVRYSEDIDFDVVTIATGTLRNKVDRVLSGPLVGAPLRSLGLSIAETTAPKQTATTQRWKLGLQVGTSATLVRTKIEFSRRDAIEGAAFEATPKETTRPYGLTPVLASHYDRRSAIVQKIHALDGRAEPQARDVFDLAHLFSRAGLRVALGADERAWLPGAIEHAMGISFDEYVSKVVAYLEPEQAPPYASRAAWDELQGRVVSELESLA